MSAVEERLNSQVNELKAQLEALQNELDGLRSR
jgi:prefoldin subunit 5